MGSPRFEALAISRRSIAAPKESNPNQAPRCSAIPIRALDAEILRAKSAARSTMRAISAAAIASDMLHTGVSRNPYSVRSLASNSAAQADWLKALTSACVPSISNERAARNFHKFRNGDRRRARSDRAFGRATGALNSAGSKRAGIGIRSSCQRTTSVAIGVRRT